MIRGTALLGEADVLREGQWALAGSTGAAITIEANSDYTKQAPTSATQALRRKARPYRNDEQIILFPAILISDVAGAGIYHSHSMHTAAEFGTPIKIDAAWRPFTSTE